MEIVALILSIISSNYSTMSAMYLILDCFVFSNLIIFCFCWFNLAFCGVFLKCISLPHVEHFELQIKLHCFDWINWERTSGQNESGDNHPTNKLMECINFFVTADPQEAFSVSFFVFFLSCSENWNSEMQHYMNWLVEKDIFCSALVFA